MDRTTGTILIALGAALALGVAFGMRDRLSRAIVTGLLGGAGVIVGTGALLVQNRAPNLANWAVTVIALAVLTPLHFHLLLGPPRSGANA